MGFHRLVVSAALFTLSLNTFGQAPIAPAPNVTESDDGYHLLDWLSTSSLANYTEWWYFNVYDTSNHVQAIFSYLINNPFGQSNGLLPLGISELTAVAYTPGGILTESDVYLAHSFSASFVRADVQVGSNSVSVLNASSYQIKGASRDGRIAWDLMYDRSAPSWYAAKRFNVGPQPWELMNWLLYMPAASVSGTLTVDGNAYNVNATGYHDHNWGEWQLTRVAWNWAQFSQPGLTFDLGDFPNKPGGIASIELNGQRYIFQEGQYTLQHTVWAYDASNKVYYPTTSVFQANNGTAQVTLTITGQNTTPLKPPLPPSAPNAIVYEQTAAFTGQVLINGSSTPLQGNGFREYTALTQQ